MAERKFHEKVETWVVVTIISVLVWLYAEATVLKSESRQIQVQFVEPTGTYAIDPVAAQTVRVDFRASSGQIQQFAQTTGRPLIIEVEPDAALDTQEQFVNLNNALLTAGLADLGITDLETDPEIQEVRLRRLQSIELPIEIDSQTRGRIGASPTIMPDTVTVTAPADVVDALQNDSVLAMLSEVELELDDPSREAVANNVPLRFPSEVRLADPWINAETRSVRVNYTPANDSAQTRRERIPLFINLPVDQQANFVVQPTDGRLFLRDVTLIGPADTIRAIEADDSRYRLWAELKLSNLDRVDRTTIVYPVIRGAPNLSTDPDPLPGIEVSVRRRGIGP
jgi:hypothetical protein